MAFISSLDILTQLSKQTKSDYAIQYLIVGPDIMNKVFSSDDPLLLSAACRYLVATKNKLMQYPSTNKFVRMQNQYIMDLTNYLYRNKVLSSKSLFGVPLALGIQGEYKFTLLATVLVVVVLTVIIFGGTTAGMLEVLNIKTGCISEEDTSDDEFDIEAPRAINLLNGSSIQTDLGPYSDNNSPDISIDQFAVSSNKNLPNNISATGGNTFGGLNETENTSPNPESSTRNSSFSNCHCNC